MRNLIVGIFFTGCCGAAYSQSTFQKQIPVQGCYAVESYDDGSLLTGGYHADKCARLCKLSPQGEVSWMLQACPTGLPSENSIISHTALTPDQEAWVVTQRHFAPDKFRYYLNRFDPAGNLLWSRLFSTERDAFGAFIWSHISVDAAGNLWNVISDYAYTGSNNSTSKFTIFRTDAATNTMWQKNITITSASKYDYEPYGVFAASVDDIFVFGTAYKHNTTETGDGFIICFDRDGQVKWARQYATMRVDQIRSQFQNGDLLASGSFDGDFTLARIKTDGSLVWVKRKVPSLNGYIVTTPYLSHDKQSIWLAAHFNYKSQTVQDTVMLYKLNAAGNVQWGKGFWDCKYNQVYGGTPTPDNGFALLWKHPRGSVVTKVNADGQLNNGCPELSGSLFPWTSPAIGVTPFAITVANGTLPAPEVLAWERIAVSSQDFCPTDYAEAFFEAPDSVCTGKRLQLHADSNAVADLYTWHTPTGIPSQRAGATHTPTFYQKGVHQVQLIQQYGFCADTFQRTIQAIGLPPLPELADTVICELDSLFVDVTITDALTYAWNDGHTLPARVVAQPGQYSVTVSDGICAQRDSFTLAYFTAPPLLLATDTLACENATIIPSISPGEVAAWWWDGQMAVPPFAVGALDGAHTLEARFANGCVVHDSILVQIINCGDDVPVYIPNAISLRENSFNQIFELSAPHATPVQSAIYDRWGELLYSTAAGVWPHWDGTFQGRTVPVGVYLFVCTLRFLDGSEKTFVRDITVVF